jgi:hypothetical protein
MGDGGPVADATVTKTALLRPGGVGGIQRLVNLGAALHVRGRQRAGRTAAVPVIGSRRRERALAAAA